MHHWQKHRMQKRKLAHSALIYMALGFLPLGSSLLLTPVYTQYLSPDEYGIIALSSVLQTYLSLIVCFSLDAAFSRFYFNHYQDEKRTNALLSTVLITITGITLVVGFILMLLGNPLLELIFRESRFTFTSLGWQVLITSGLGMCYTVISLFYRDSENLKMFSILAVVYFLLMTGCTFYGVVIAEGGAAGSITGKMTGTIITLLIFFIIIFNKTGIHFQRSDAVTMLKFSFPLFIYGMMAAAFDTMDRFFISRYFDLGVLGQYNFAFVIASVIGIVLASYQAAVNPPIYKMMLDKENNHSLQLNVIMNRLIWTSLLFASLCITLSYYVIKYFINSQYHASLQFIPVLALSFIPRAYYMAWSYPLFTENKAVVLPWINGISIVAGILSNFILIQSIGILAIPVSVVIIKLTQALCAFIAINKLKIYTAEMYQFKTTNTVVLLFTSAVWIVTVYWTRNSSDNFINFVPLIIVLIPFISTHWSYIKNK